MVQEQELMQFSKDSLFIQPMRVISTPGEVVLQTPAPDQILIGDVIS